MYVIYLLSLTDYFDDRRSQCLSRLSYIVQRGLRGDGFVFDFVLI